MQKVDTCRKEENVSKKIFLTWRELKDAGWAYGVTHTARLERAGKFPMHVKIPGAHRNSHKIWAYEEVMEWFQKQLNERQVCARLEKI